MALEQPKTSAPNASDGSPYTHGGLYETMFTPFQVHTVDDWTDLEDHPETASKTGAQKDTTVYHCIVPLWYVISAFHLFNLLVGTLPDQYHVIMEEASAYHDQKELLPLMKYVPWQSMGVGQIGN